MIWGYKSNCLQTLGGKGKGGSLRAVISLAKAKIVHVMTEC